MVHRYFGNCKWPTFGKYFDKQNMQFWILIVVWISDLPGDNMGKLIHLTEAQFLNLWNGLM